MHDETRQKAHSACLFDVASSQHGYFTPLRDLIEGALTEART